MAQLQTIGGFIEVDICWIEVDLYGPTTVEQIIDDNRVKRGQAAHTVTLQARFALCQNAIFHQELECLERLQKVAEDLATTLQRYSTDCGKTTTKPVIHQIYYSANPKQ